MAGLKYWVWLSEVKGLTNRSKLLLLDYFGTPENVYYADEDEYRLVEGIEPRQIALLEQNIIQATVIQRPFNMGYMAVQQAVRVAQGEEPEDFVEVACVLITRENMYTQENQKLLFPVMEQ